jgi:cyclase
MDKEEQLVEELVKNALYRMDESTRMINKSLDELTDDEVWKKPNASLNSIANLILHLSGNISQYIISSLGETEDNRNRDGEFIAISGLTKIELLQKLDDTVNTAKRVIFDATLDQFLKMRQVQGFAFSGVGVVLHTVEHYSYHTGQIAFWVKQLKNKDLGFYEGMDLNTKNNKDGRTVKGINFVDLRDAGDPVELAEIYSREGADELVFLDISATEQKRKTLADLVYRVGEKINIPFTVGGGISSVEDVDILLQNGADKVSINSSAIKNPQLINDLVAKFGSQCIVVAIDAKQIEGKWTVYLVGGKVPTELDLFDWAKEVERRGAGEILFTSMDNDGTKDGFANEALARLSTELNIPIIASGGAGNMQHFTDTFVKGKADAALAASVFHFKEIEINDLKKELQKEGIPVRL